ncbi:MAG: tripartite tricarboxylate transporter TctB family protein [Syntrophales bacterium]
MTKERGGSIIFLAAGLYGLVFSLGLPMGRWNEPGPGVFPLAISILLCLSGILWFIRGGKGGETSVIAVRQGFFLQQYSTVIWIVGLTALFIGLLEPLGYLVTSILYLFALFFWVSRYRVWSAAAMAVACGVGSWLFFEKLLTTPLPKGLWPL